MTILVTGAAGQLGGVTVERFAAMGRQVVATDRQQLDLSRHADVVRFIGEVKPGLIVNCAAYNDVEAAEDQHVAAFEANAFAVRSLARAAREVGATLVHYSTDFVFDGLGTQPYRESDPPSPQSVYASSKLVGEWFAADAPRHYVLRVESLFGGPAARSSIDRIIDALLRGDEARVFVDRVVSPSFVEDVAAATEALVTRGAPPGLYHCVNSGYATWYEVAAEIARQAGVSDEALRPVKVADVTLRARRPQFAALSNEKLRQAAFDMPAWQDAIRRYLVQRNARRPA
jgi:dTDP-4-dehydrorhamnose reductase